ncbi:hypothetical protein B566_EDAN009784 [Ephemera danica]|nr:hypothetical protein B566_EDAN009784 [Ephemera danica]
MVQVLVWILLLLSQIRASRPATPSSRPNIVFILADDLGWNDVGFTGRSDLQTPNIDALAYHGRILSQHYSQPTCTPSRTALLTGKYPIRTGMQGFPLTPGEPRALPLDQRLLPQYMKELGYQTHLVGKWHVGCHEWKYTPTARGFDTHFGYLNGYIGYYNHTMDILNMTGHDFWRGVEPMYDLRGRYVTDLLTEESVRLIENAGSKKNSDPLFLLISHLAPHSGNPGSYHEYPEEDLERFNYIPDMNRRKYAAMVWNLDKSVGHVVKALAETKMLHNTIIAFVSDNGAQTIGLFPNDGSNYPFRGHVEKE